MCENNTYHIVEDYSITEIIEIEGKQEIIGTTLHNYAMPSLRYRTGDFVVLAEDKCTCQRNSREILEISGRSSNYIVLPNGNKIPSILLECCMNLANNVIEVQLIQEHVGEIIINYTGNNKFDDQDKTELIKKALEHTASDMLIELNEMKKIPRGPNGKFFNFVSRLNLK